jgi:bacterial polymer biosynthesis proteins, WecB/TagA/CpsF family
MDSVLILNTNINVTSVEEVSTLLQKRDSKTIAVCNTNTLVRSYKDSELQNKINAFKIRVPDGFPVAKASNIIYKNEQERVDGYNIFHRTLEKGLKNNLTHYFFGSDELIIKKLKSELLKKYPNLIILGHTCPPYLNYEELVHNEFVNDLIVKKPDIVWVSLGFPKQEEFIDLLLKNNNLDSNFAAVGAVFEWSAGTKIKAPEILANIGLEWIFRLIQEPRRLYKRYFVDNFLFIIYIIKQIRKAKDS